MNAWIMVHERLLVLHLLGTTFLSADLSRAMVQFGGASCAMKTLMSGHHDALGWQAQDQRWNWSVLGWFLDRQMIHKQAHRIKQTMLVGHSFRTDSLILWSAPASGHAAYAGSMLRRRFGLFWCNDADFGVIFPATASRVLADFRWGLPLGCCPRQSWPSVFLPSRKGVFLFCLCK